MVMPSVDVDVDVDLDLDVVDLDAVDLETVDVGAAAFLDVVVAVVFDAVDRTRLLAVLVDGSTVVLDVFLLAALRAGAAAVVAAPPLPAASALPGAVRSPPNSLMGLSSRRRLNAACRSRPSFAQPRKATSAIKTGRTQCTSRGRPGICVGNSSVAVSLCSACNSAVILPSKASSKPVPTRPT